MQRSRLTCLLFAVLALGTAVSARGGSLARFATPVGSILVEMYDADKPVTVSNFWHYVTSGAYNGMFLHRWESGFVIQGGGFVTLDRHTTNAQAVAVPSFGNITNEYQAGRIFSNAHGTLAMARVGGVTNSANSQWFFNLTNNAFLDAVDGGFTVFGHVVAGTKALERFNQTPGTNGLYWLYNYFNAPFNELPSLAIPTTVQQLLDEDLLYTPITAETLPQLRIEVRTDGSRLVQWTSISNLVHHLESSTTLPPAWQDLVTTNGTGGTLQLIQPAADSPARFYRVRLE